MKRLFAAFLVTAIVATTAVGQNSSAGSNVVLPTGAVDGVFPEEMLDELPVREGGRPLRYPAMLLRNGVDGSVVIEFVIAENGRPEAESIRVLDSSNKAFERAAEDFIKFSKFTPGLIEATPVRVRVRQRIRFETGNA